MSTTGVDWTAEQNRDIGRIYFQMLQKEQDGERYVKAVYNRTVQEQTGKSRASIEYKFRNISFLLQEIHHQSSRDTYLRKMRSGARSTAR